VNPSVTFFDDYAASHKREMALPPVELAELIRITTASDKSTLPWLKLARFGNARSPKGSLRHDRNVIAISGVEADYDGEKITLDEAVEIADKAGLLSVIYTSPSHRNAAPRWRVLAPTSREYPPPERRRLLGRLNGLYRGIFANESWTLSQSYYFGFVLGNPHHHVELVEGQPIDLLHELDQVWLGPPVAGNGRVYNGEGESAELRNTAELIRQIVTGKGYHVELTAIAARYVGIGMDADVVADTLRGLMLSHDKRDARWNNRYREIPCIVESARQKYAPLAERRRAIARLTHQLVRRKAPAELIKAAILAEAERLELSAECALAIANNILLEAAGDRHG